LEGCPVAGDRTKITFYAPPDIAAQLQEIATATGSTLSAAVTVLVAHTLAGRGTAYMSSARTLVARSGRR